MLSTQRSLFNSLRYTHRNHKSSYFSKPTVQQTKNNQIIITMPERGQSPPPERSSGKQLHDAPASGKGTDDASNKKDVNKEALEHLTSNPKGPLDDEVERKFAKTAK